jgi:hypothetical protein
MANLVVALDVELDFFPREGSDSGWTSVKRIGNRALPLKEHEAEKGHSCGDGAYLINMFAAMNGANE